MTDENLRLLYDAQFRWEEGMLVYRHRRRGVPVEVSDSERQRAIDRFVRTTRNTKRAALATFVLGGAAINLIIPGAFGKVVLLVASLASFGLLYAAALRWAWNMPTQGWSNRKQVGERLGRTGAFIMLVERTTWPRIIIGLVATIVLIPIMAGIGPSAGLSWPPSTVGQWVAAILVGISLPLSLATAAVKWAVTERDRLRLRGRTAIRDARRHRNNDSPQ
ncbi:hypothetical protein SH584_10760 [Sphingomonas sp. LY29]|uniref:hypothetical protein n=1 Tax=Sphingomonas sp. LY29 TaxID=3095341 RepID=UPI002D7863F4|nr:hypothetical protein [Sphingomonas sp. LY29]WRP25519.1 hypothetical protein SH584_10760 [Sphingomonas sp. LY29]